MEPPRSVWAPLSRGSKSVLIDARNMAAGVGEAVPEPVMGPFDINHHPRLGVGHIVEGQFAAADARFSGDGVHAGVLGNLGLRSAAVVGTAAGALIIAVVIVLIVIELAGAAVAIFDKIGDAPVAIFHHGEGGAPLARLVEI